MTEPGLTDNYTVADYVNAIYEHCGESLIDYCLYDTGEVVPEYIKKYNLDGADLVDQSLKGVKEKRIKFIKENMSMIIDNCVRHNANLIADLVIQVICDDMKFLDKHNEPEYLMMNSKLKADKIINKQKKKELKNKKEKTEKVGKSKFANKYQDRIKSIKDTSEAKQKNKTKIKNDEQNEPKVDILKEIENNEEVKTGVLKIKNYEEIRKEMLKKFNSKAKKN